jgi:transposase
MRNEDGVPASTLEECTRAVSGSSEESVSPRRRRTFSAAEKLRIVRLAEACLASGERGSLEAMMRTEGIYSSQLSSWRTQLGLHGSAGLASRKPGRKAKLDEKDKRYAALEKRYAALEREHHIVTVLVELQKKAHEILGIALPKPEGTS